MVKNPLLAPFRDQGTASDASLNCFDVLLVVLQSLLVVVAKIEEKYTLKIF